MITMIILNVVVLGLISYHYFKKNFTIVDLETWNTVADFYNEHQDDTEEKAGGCGFFFDQIQDVDIEEEQDDEEDEEDE